jgi:hypothetical protein
MSPKHRVSDVLDLLAARLDPIIQEGLESALQGLDWTVILTELDKSKGYPPKGYTRNDIQAQLRILTEPLGALGYPFSDKERTSSTLGNELRIVRNAFAHSGDFTWLDAWRAADFGVRMLAYFGDSDGAADLVAVRDSLLPQLAEERGLSLVSAGAEAAASTVADLNATEAVTDVPGESAEPGPTSAVEVALSPGAMHSLAASLGATRPAFTAWQIVIAGPKLVIDELPKKVAKLQVRAVATEIVEFEGPVEVERLARLTAGSFGWHRLASKRVKQIAYQIRQIEGITVDEYGFVWPAGLTPGTWTGFRPQSGTSARTFNEISPLEIANAISWVRGQHPKSSEDAVTREVITIFGRSKLTVGAVKHLELAKLLAG